MFCACHRKLYELAAGTKPTFPHKRQSRRACEWVQVAKWIPCRLSVRVRASTQNWHDLFCLFALSRALEGKSHPRSFYFMRILLWSDERFEICMTEVYVGSTLFERYLSGWPAWMIPHDQVIGGERTLLPVFSTCNCLYLRGRFVIKFVLSLEYIPRQRLHNQWRWPTMSVRTLWLQSQEI